MTPFDHDRVRVRPLAERQSLSAAGANRLDPDSDAPSQGLGAAARGQAEACARAVRAARARGASVMLVYGAHLIRNGAAGVVDHLLEGRWLTHLATNGAGSIHDWEYAYLGRSLETVRTGVATGTFGAWDETGRYLHLALLAGNLAGEGYGQAIGRLIAEDGAMLPDPEALERSIRDEPAHPATAARAEMLAAMRRHHWPRGRVAVSHGWKAESICASAFRHGTPITVHPGIGYDIVAVHPMFDGAVIGRAATADFRRFCDAVEGLDGGVVLSIGSAVMGPQVFEKALSCVNNVRLQDGRPIVGGHAIFVVDLQDGGGFDWSSGLEPPKSSAAYYLRFCKSYARMGGALHYVQADNAAFLHAVARLLGRGEGR